MNVRHVILAIFLTAALTTPLYAQVQPGEADDETAMDIIAQHDEASVAYELFGSEYEEFLDGDESVALFVPTDDALDDLDADEISALDRETLFRRHISTGLASQSPIEFIEWFATADGEQIAVSVDDDAVLLNDRATVVEAIAATNGVVYIIDQTLES